MTKTWSTNRCPKTGSQNSLESRADRAVKSWSQFLSEGEVEASKVSTRTLQHLHSRLHILSISDRRVCHFHYISSSFPLKQVDAAQSMSFGQWACLFLRLPRPSAKPRAPPRCGGQLCPMPVPPQENYIFYFILPFPHLPSRYPNTFSTAFLWEWNEAIQVTDRVSKRLLWCLEYM